MSQQYILKQNGRVKQAMGRYVGKSSVNTVFWMEGVSMEKPNKIFFFFITPLINSKQMMMKDQMCWRLCKDKNSNHTHVLDLPSCSDILEEDIHNYL